MVYRYFFGSSDLMLKLGVQLVQKVTKTLLRGYMFFKCVIQAGIFHTFKKHITSK